MTRAQFLKALKTKVAETKVIFYQDSMGAIRTRANFYCPIEFVAGTSGYSVASQRLGLHGRLLSSILKAADLGPNMTPSQRALRRKIRKAVGLS